MYVWDLVHTLRRRWYVLLPGLLMTVLAAGLTMKLVPPQFQATGSVLLTPPAIVGSGADPNQRTNPYLNFGAPLGATAEVVSSGVNSQQTIEQLQDRGATGTYLVAVDQNASAPVISVEATSRDSAKALATMTLVVAEIKDRLQQIQGDAGAPKKQYIQAHVVTVSPNAPAIHGSLIRVLAVVVLIGLLVSCGGAVIAEGIGRGRSKKRDDETVEVDGLHDPAALSAPTQDRRFEYPAAVVKSEPSSAPAGERTSVHASAVVSRASTS